MHRQPLPSKTRHSGKHDHRATHNDRQGRALPRMEDQLVPGDRGTGFKKISGGNPLKQIKGC